MIHPLRLAGPWLLALCAAWSVSTAHAADNWDTMRQAKARDDVSTWVRPVEGMAVKAFRGETELRANAWTVLALLADTRNLANWVFQGHSSEHPDGLPPEQARLRFKGVWPADDRDVLIRTAVSQLPGGLILVESRQVEGLAPNKCCVRIPFLRNVFRLTPLKGGWTRVVFETQIDLGGQVPAWLANMVSTKAPLVTLQNMQQQVKKAAYQGKTAADLPSFYHRGALFVVPDEHLQADAP